MRSLPLADNPRELDRQVLAARGPKSNVDRTRPYLYFVEPECNRDFQVEDVATLFLVNRECPLRCTMCDLWKNTLDEPLKPGEIGQQIRYAFERLQPASTVKLYNSGNFFDRQAIPTEDHSEIAELVADHRTVIVENHPRFCGPVCAEFQSRIDGQLEIALGLETVHEATLKQLNKRMSLDQFRRTTEELLSSEIQLRAFIMLKPPGINEEEGVEWAIRSIEFAFDCGVNTCAVIPTRGGNGLLDQFLAEGLISPPTVQSMETVLDAGLALGNRERRLFVDLWDIERLPHCPHCVKQRVSRMNQMNLHQLALPSVACENGCSEQAAVPRDSFNAPSADET